jgi:phospholipid-binding lipoprotein MlaA
MRQLLIALLFALTLGANSSAALAQDSAVYDPIEPFNRAVFAFNRGVDFIILKPIATGYKNYVPGFIQTSVASFLRNLSSPVVLLNDALQGDWVGVDNTIRRFFVNSTLGLGGLIDVASYHGLTPTPREDFGQTLGYYGVSEGPYMVLPIFGPSNLRDAFGRVVDMLSDPYTMIARDAEQDGLLIGRAGLTTIDTRATLLGAYDDMVATSIDPYNTVRSAYTQQRTYAVQDRTYQVGNAGADPYDTLEKMRDE